MVGADKHGKVDKVSFKNGNKDVVPDNLYVSSFNKTKRYIIITYTDLDNSSSGQNEVLRNTFDSQFHYATYVIDTVTNLTFKLEIEDFYSFRIGTSGYGIVGADCGDEFIVTVDIGRYNTEMNDSNYKYYKIGVVDNKLQVKEFFSSELMRSAYIYFSDIYGNCMLTNSSNKKFILSNSGQLTELPDDAWPTYGYKNPDEPQSPREIYRAIDGKIYFNNQVLNESGVFVNTEHIIENYTLPSENLIYSEDNIDIYCDVRLGSSISDGYDFYFWIYTTAIKVVNNNGKYEFHPIKINTQHYSLLSSTMVFVDNKAYVLENDREILITDLLTGAASSVSLNKDIIVRSIAPYGVNTIEFEGIDMSLNAVYGIVDKDGNANYEYSKQEFACYYILPLN